FQEDNSLGISIGNFANEMTALYVSQRDPLLFSDEALKEGIGNASREALTFGVFFFDYDLDGWLDLLTVNGHIEPEIQKVSPTQSYAQAPQLFWNQRGKSSQRGFARVTAESSGPDILTPLVGRGSAFGDLDGDGDLDVVVTQVGMEPKLFFNSAMPGQHYLRLKLNGTKGNRNAIGSVIRVRAGGKTMTSQVMPTRGYLSQSELPVTFGLGRTDKVEDVQITWSDGSKSNLPKPVIDRTIQVDQPKKQ
ncbi:MAG: ASPIC/UnbV domain-containing protein, partial [Verrucomicrobiota bacterium]|nr:ASPIC/UnbV domain-containing protein [Verrucomicrobiota bacterium]